MDVLLRLLFTNAAAAGLLAALAFAVSRMVRRPALAHGLWLLALLKLLTPPLVPLPLLPAWQGLETLTAAPTPPAVRMVAEPAPATGTPKDGPLALASRGTPAPVARPLPRNARFADAVAPRSEGPAGAALSSPAGFALATSLAGGALAVLLLAAFRFRRFRRLLAHAEPAPALIASRAAALAGELGLRRVPPVLVVSARIPPMLWPEPGGPKLLLPRDLLRELSAPERDALLAHELAHVRRCDHWVRLLEMAATALFWWYPVTWWARAALRRAEERCCDEWVLRVLPRSAEAYANGLLKSLTFVSSASAPVPALASGASPLHELETRLKEILMSRPAPRLAAPLRIALLAAAALALAVFPTHARNQDTPAATTATPAEPAAPAAVAPHTPRTTTPATAPRPAAIPAVPATSAVAAVPEVAAVSAVAAAPAVAAVSAVAGVPAPARMAAAGEDAHRALEAQRRVLEEKRRALQKQELELQRQELELQARADQDELRAVALRLRAEGKLSEAESCERQLEAAGKRMDLQRRRFELDAERLALEMKLADAALAQRDSISSREAEAIPRRIEAELKLKQRATEVEARALAREAQQLAAEDQIHAIGEATEAMARQIAEQLEALKAAHQGSGARIDFEREIKRLEAAIAVLKAGAAASPRSAPRPEPKPVP